MVLALAGHGGDSRGRPAGVAWFTYDFGLEYAGFRKGEATQLREQLDETVRRQQSELAELNARTAAAERQLQIERATYGDLAKQVKSLAQENATLKEDLAFFQSLTATGKEGAVSVNRFRLMPESRAGGISLPAAAGADRGARQGIPWPLAVCIEPAAGWP